MQTAISAIANEASATTGFDAVISLLKLKEVLYNGPQATASLTKARELIWRNDLIHLMVELLREDFSVLQGQWGLATELARLMVEVFSALKPSQDSSTQSDDLVQEYYNFLLPAATDSLLILANNIQECETKHVADNSAYSSSTSLLEPFSSTLNNLVWLCSSHKVCSDHVLRSPYILHLLISDNHGYSIAVLTALTRIIESNTESLSSLPSHTLESLLDELVFKASCSEKVLVVPSTQLLAIFSLHLPPVMDLICTRYKGLQDILLKWGEDFFNANTHQFIVNLVKKAQRVTTNDRDQKAAAIIQAGWRGYCTRRKLTKMKKGIRLFQRFYRQWKHQKEAQKQLHFRKQIAALSRQAEEIKKARMKHETQASLIQKMPATLVKKYVIEEEIQSAIKLQSWWRGVLTRKRVSELKGKHKRERSALTIQRWVRKVVLEGKDKKEPDDMCDDQFGMKLLTTEEQREIEMEIIQKLKTSLPQCKTSEQQSDIQQKVMNSYCEFQASRRQQRIQEKECSLLIAQLEAQSELLLNMPSLAHSNTDTVKKYATGSRVVLKMAEKAHREELKAQKLPWWKRLETNPQEIPCTDLKQPTV